MRDKNNKVYLCGMANKKNRPNNTASTPAPRPARAVKPQQPAGAGFVERYKHMLIPAGIGVITWLFLKTCTNNLFTNWDDPGYIKDNPLVKDLSAEGLKNIFSTPIMGNYHPLTILSYALEYSFVQLQPYLYHVDSLLLHILTTLLVYRLAILLTRRQVAASVVALLFGLHPMHVESVAWLAGRKDVLYGAFYIGACITHIYYIRSEQKKALWYSFTILLFLLSLLSKPVAVVLPVTLLLIDYFEKRPLNIKLLIEKIPHFLISLGFGYESIIDQQKFGSLNTLNVAFNFIERIALGCYALFTYLWKIVAPVQLCNFYPYPDKPLHAVYYIFPLLIAGLAFIVWAFGRKNRAVVFGTLFFLVNIILLLQFIPVGGAIIADRYSYIAYFGLFFVAGWFVSGYFEPGGDRKKGNTILIVTLVYTLALGYMSNQRCGAWYDATTLWTDEIQKVPERAPNAYNNLGFNYFNRFNESVNPQERQIFYDSSYMLLNKAIELQPDFANPYISLGELERSVNKFADAKRNYYKALSLKASDEDANAYLGLAIISAISRNFDSSAYCFHTALKLKPYFPEAHSNLGNLFDMMHQSDSALAHYAIAISQNADMIPPYLNRGRLLTRLHRTDEAMQDFERCLALNPTMGEVYYARAFAYAQKHNNAAAAQDVEKAISLGYTQIDNNFYQAMKGGK